MVMVRDLLMLFMEKVMWCMLILFGWVGFVLIVLGWMYLNSLIWL